jgi:large subunit ribosomal protein L24
MAVHQPTAPRVTKVAELRRGDEVVVLTGKDAGKRGTIERLVRPDRVVVGGINIAKRHTKPRTRQGRNDRAPRVQQGGILEIAQPIPVAKVMVVCSRCGKPTRIGHATLENGRRVRVCKQCGEQLEAKS